MLMCDDQLKMNHAANILSEHLGYREFEMESVHEGNLNYCYKITKGNQEIFVKLFGDRLSSNKRKYRSLPQRYEMEKFVLQTCNDAGLPTPKLLASLDDQAILVQENIGGESLMTCFSNKEEPEHTLFSLGMWLGGFHNLFEIREQKKQTLYDEYSFIKRLNINVHDGANVVKRFCDLLRRIVYTKKVLSCSDCHFGNFIISNSLLYGIDFEQCLYQSPGIDLAGIFVSYLDAKENNLDKGARTNLSINMLDYHHLLNGYEEATGENYNSVFIAYVATVLLRKYSKTDKKNYLYYLFELDNYVRR